MEKIKISWFDQKVGLEKKRRDILKIHVYNSKQLSEVTEAQPPEC